MFTNTIFEFDGEKSTDYGLILASLDISMKNVPFGIEREIIEDKPSKTSIPYFFGIDKKPLYFTTTLVSEENLNYETRINIVRWLFKDEYKPFISTDHPDIIFNCIVVEKPEKILIGNIPRVIELTFKCDAPWAWTPFITNHYDLSNNSTYQIITMENRSNIEKYNYPELWIKSLDGGTISLQNNSDNGRIFKFENLQENEIIYIDNKLRQVETNISSIYRLKNFNRNWLRLIYGINQIEVVGKCLIIMRTRYEISL